MTEYIARRLLLNLAVLWVVATAVFFATHALPGDFVIRQLVSQLEVQEDYAQVVAEARRRLGLDKPIWERYGHFLWDTVRLDLGRSLETGRTTWQELARRYPATLELGVLIVLVAFATSIPIGLISAIRQDSWLDNLLRGFAVLHLAMPVFFLALLLMLAVLRLDLWTIDIVGSPHLWSDPAGAIQLYAIPALAGGIASGAGIARILRSQMLEVMRNDFIRTAFAKGLEGRVVWLRHALKNAMLPVLTVMGFAIVGIVDGAVILENMFDIDGVGRYLVERLEMRDLPPFQGTVMLIAFVVVTMNLVVDIAYAWLDPRIRYR
jgi:peptide/nickel transport system permease protein